MSCVQGDIQEPHPFQIHFEDRDVGTEALRHPGSIDAGSATPQNHYTSRQDSRNTAQEHAASAIMLSEKIASYQDRHPSGNFAHRLEQREPAIHLDGFIS